MLHVGMITEGWVRRTVLIPFEEDIFILKVQESWQWTTFSDSLSSFIRANQDTMHHWTLSEDDLRYLIGPNILTALPLEQGQDKISEDISTPSEGEGTEGHTTTTTREE